MRDAFAYLIVRSTSNMLRSRLRRMRQPRYAIGTLVGLLYFGWVFGFGAVNSLGRIGSSPEAVEMAGTLLLFLMLALMWLVTGKRAPALGFTPAEVQYLFPAPISRQQLIWYRITRSQIAVLLSAAFSTLLARPSSVSGVVIVFVGLCLIYGALGFHGMGMALSRESLGKGGWRAAVRFWVPLVLVVSVVVLIAAALWTEWSRLQNLPDWGARMQAVGRIMSRGAIGVALWPIRAMVNVPTADGWTAFAWALPPALLIWGANAMWVVRSDAAFEEASAKQSEKIAKILQGRAPIVVPGKSRRAPFALTHSGRPETAILWKNLISVTRKSRGALVGGIIALSVMAGVGLGFANDDSTSPMEMASIACLVLAAMSMFNGPLQARSDLRQDLAHLATIKTWPIRGAAIVRGEVLAPTLICSAITGFLFAMGAILGGVSLTKSLHTSGIMLVQGAVGILLTASGLIAVQVVGQNGVAVLFPAWTRLGPRAAGSVEGMGRQILMIFGSLLLLPIAALPAALVAGLAWVALQVTLGFVPVIIPAIIATAVLLAECWIATEAIGAALDRTDISAVDPA